ncbi:MAG: phosphopantetheine adenylyltransferase [Acidobacteria bacterium]|nr:phosphopantetheine adenylyltransferase [Acidobacteriota bacterium]
MHYVISIMLVIVGIIHLLPLTGVFSKERLIALYGISLTEPNIIILMRHRAVLFGLLGLFLIYAAFRPTLQSFALVAGFISVISFLWLAFSIGNYNSLIARVVIADIIALICLVIATILYLYRLKQD